MTESRVVPGADPPPAGHGRTVTALAFTPEGKFLAFSADERLLAIATDSGWVELWDMTTGQYSGSPLHRAEQHPVMLPLFKFLGTNPANWTTNPFAD
jgi:WD40 repeat protein